MSNLTESASWDAGIYQIETGDTVFGGASGVANSQAKSLANRTTYLKAVIDAFAGVTIPHSGYTCPPGFLWAFGQPVLRATYAALLDATTVQITGTTTNGNATITGIPTDLTPFGLEGSKVEGAGVPAGAYVKSLTSNSITLSANLTASASGVTLRLFPHGNGDGSTTFNVVDMRGRVPAGRDNMGGTAASVLASTLSGTTTAGSAVVTGLSSTEALAIGMNAVGANLPVGLTIASIDSATQVTLSSGAGVLAGTANIRFSVVDGAVLGAGGGTPAHKLVTAQMPAHTHPVNNSASTTLGGVYSTASLSAANGAQPVTASTGGDQAHPNVQPTRVLNFIVKT